MASRINSVTSFPRMDKKDFRILSLLSQDSRLRLSEIAQKVLLSRDAVRYRMDKMEKNGIIQRYSVKCDFKQFGYKQYHIFMQLDEMEEQQEKEFFDFLSKHENIIDIIEYSDIWELELVMIAKDTSEFDALLNGILNKYSAVIEDFKILEVVNEYVSTPLPSEIIEERLPLKVSKAKIPEKIKIDETDIKLISLLSKNSRNSLYAMAEELKISSDAVNYRIKKLKEKKIITLFMPVINFSLLGYNFYTIFLSLKSFTKEDERKLIEVVRNHPNIIRAAKTIGEWNIILHVVSKSQREFHSALRHMRSSFKDIVKNYDTLVSYKEYKFETFSDVIST
jgi:Lrp/AsnC family leucine-responsive transcriptional regulator